MNTETTGSGQFREDSVRVSAVYRKTATGGTPQYLDERVLRRAAKAARPRLGRMRSWTRPLAWAATIALSVAIVLEVTRNPAPDGIPPTPALEIRRIEAPAAARSGTGEPPGPAVVTDEAEAPSAPAALPSRQSFGESLEAAPAAAEDTGAGRPQDRLSTEQDTDPGTPAASLPAAVRKLALPTATKARDDAAESAACDANARRTAEAWLACIEQLETSGRTAAAERERELLIDAFPDFLPQ